MRAIHHSPSLVQHHRLGDAGSLFCLVSDAEPLNIRQICPDTLILSHLSGK
jgi:hypothetical protein